MSRLTVLPSIRFEQTLPPADQKPRIEPKRPQFPSLYQINTRVRIRDLSQSLGRHAKLDDIPDKELDHLIQSKFN
jgi:hypothetical protein